MAEFLTAYNKTAQWEGGYVDDPKDRGGETYAGISRKFHPKWAGWQIVDCNKPLKKGEKINDSNLNSLVKQFYYTNFWQPIQGDFIEHQNVANFVYDWHVNSGKTGIVMVQKAMGFSMKDADGIVGSKTLSALNTANIETLKTERTDFVQKIVKNAPSQRKFLQGWLNRIASF